MTEIRIATRGSSLALAQARTVAGLIGDLDPTLDVRLVEIETMGDRDRTSPIATLSELGAFVRGVQNAVIEGRADLAVHSLKDLPVQGPDELELVAIPERRSPFDVLVGSSLGELTPGSVVGTGSARRSEQLAMLRPDLATSELRGNVETRLRKVEERVVAAAVLARAGLERLGRDAAIEEEFSAQQMLPAPGQGALAVETLRNGEAAEILRSLDDPNQRPLVETERALLAATGAGCRSALGALATWEGDRIHLEAFVADGSGRRRVGVIADTPSEAADRARMELGL